MCPLTILGRENHGSGHFYLAENRTFLLCVDTPHATRRTPPRYATFTATRRLTNTYAECGAQNKPSEIV
jgi:hypothetical protein